jgi:transposase
MPSVAWNGGKMIAISGTARIFLCNTPVDLRNGFEGLSALANHIFSENITGGAYFVFVNRVGDMMKILYWDGDGFAIWHKRLEKGTFRSLEQKKTLERRDLLMMLEGVIPKKKQKRFWI